ncbi:MAG: succinyl-diaminopimelate desuccinylase [Actinomycetota bacterium]|nr:succinyl-diaminopimelate desuccinylase [Actinomycetota bacterium]
MTHDLLGLTEELCEIPSVSGTEGALADVVEARLKASDGRLLIERIGANVVARTELGCARRVVLAGHLDTVPANGNQSPRRDGDVLHGLGTADMKGGLAVLLALADDLVRRGRARFDVTLVLYEGEEVADEHNGLRRLFAEAPQLVQGDLAILLEPTGGWVEAGCQGTIHVRATFDGVRAHSARPWMGTNAIHRAAPFLDRCARFEAATVDVDSLQYREALQVVQIAGGIANNVVPDRCAVVVNRRYAPSRPLDAAVAEVVGFCTDAGADHVEVLNASMAAPPNLAHPLIAEMVGVYDLPVRPKLGWTDVARFAAHGIAACNFGPGDPELAHTADERVDRASLDACLGLLETFLGIG